MQKLILSLIIMFGSATAHANCFKTDVESPTEAKVKALLQEILNKVDYSECSDEELTVAADGLIYFAKAQAEASNTTNDNAKLMAVLYTSISKASLSLIKLEQNSRK